MSVEADGVEPGIILLITVVEFEPARVPVVPGDAVHAHCAGDGDRHRQAVGDLRLVIRLDPTLQCATEGQPFVVHILHLHPHDGVLRMLKD